MKFILSTMIILTISSVQAVDCRLHSEDLNWPEDKILKVISCEKIHSEKDYFLDDQLCLSVREDQHSKFETKTYKVSLATNGSKYPIALLNVTVNNNGRSTYGNISHRGNGEVELSGIFSTNNWNVNANVNLERPDQINVTVKSKGFGFGKLKHKATYKCDEV